MSDRRLTPISRSKFIGVYTIKCAVTGKAYVGWSANVRARIVWHKSHLRGGKHSRKDMQRDFLAYGEKSFSFEVKECRDQDTALKKEAALIAKYFKVGKCYNGIVPVTIATWCERAARKKALKASRMDWSEEGRAKLKILVGKCRGLLNYRDDASFLLLVESFLEMSGVKATAFGTAVVGDAHFVFELRRPNPRSCTLRTATRVSDHILRVLDGAEFAPFSSPVGVAA